MSSPSVVCRLVHIDDCDEQPRMQHEMGSTPAFDNITPHNIVPQQNSSTQTLTSDEPTKSIAASGGSMSYGCRSRGTDEECNEDSPADDC